MLFPSLRRFFLILLLLVPVAAHAADPNDDAWVLLDKAGQAAHKLSYKGVFVFQAGPNISSMQITHMNYAQGEFARLISLDGAPREVLRQGNDVVIYSPRNEKVMIQRRRVQSTFPALLPGVSDALKQSYQIRMAGSERVGGRDSTVVYLDPRDHYRYGYRFSVDQEFGLLLKSIMLDEHNQAIEQVAFNQLSLLDTQDMDWFHPTVTPGKTYVMQPEETVSPTVDGDGWTIAQLPPGFRQIDQVVRKIPGKPGPVHHLIFSDGLASVSLFIEALNKSSPPKQGLAVQGCTNVYATTVDGHQIVVVGEVPEATVKLIASAVSFNK